MPSFRARTIGKEALRAVMAWSVVYFAMFGCLVIYKWQTRDYYQAEHARVLLSLSSTPPQREVKVVVKKVIKEVIKKVPRTKSPSASSNSFNDLSHHEDELQSVVSQLRRQDEINEATVTTFAEQHSILQELDAKIRSLKLSKQDDTTIVPETGQLDKLLMMTSLSLLESSDDLESAFAVALDELNNITEHPEVNAVDWNSIETALLVKPYPPKQPSSMNCPSSSNSNTAVEIDKSAARRSDLSQRMAKIERLLDRRSAGSELSTALMPDSMMELKKSTSSILDDLFLEILAIATSTNDNGTSVSPCIQIEQVLEMVDEGLLALHRHADLRTVLQQKVLELDPSSSADSIIFDADFPMRQPTIPDPTKVNVRRLLDTPLLTKTADWIDQLVELVGGYNDTVDQFLDSFAGRESVGGILVRRLLEVSGRVELPHPQTLAQKLRPSSASSS